jgi:hypothetical protein
MGKSGSGSLHALLPLLTFKAAFFVVALVMVQFLSTWNTGDFRIVRHWPLKGEATLVSHFATWDGAHYLFVAQYGYLKGDQSCAFYPLWPMLIKLGSVFTGGNLFVAGLVLANLFFIAAILLFRRLITEWHGLEMANTATLLLLAFPGSIFFSFIYTESLFLFLIVLFFYFLFRNDCLGVAIVGFFLPLTKAIGIFCVAPLLWHLYSNRRPAREALAVFGLIAGYVGYFAIMYFFTGNAFEGFEAQRFYPTKPSISKIIDLRLNAMAFFFIGNFPVSAVNILNRIFFASLLITLPWIWQLNKTYFVYAVFAGIVPAFSALYFSYTRNVVTCFPFFLALAGYLVARGSHRLKWFLILLFCGLETFLLYYYVNCKFAG